MQISDSHSNFANQSRPNCESISLLISKKLYKVRINFSCNFISLDKLNEYKYYFSGICLIVYNNDGQKRKLL